MGIKSPGAKKKPAQQALAVHYYLSQLVNRYKCANNLIIMKTNLMIK